MRAENTETPRLTPDGLPWPTRANGKPVKPRKDGYPSRCSAAQIKWQADNPDRATEKQEKVLAAVRKWRDEKPREVEECNRKKSESMLRWVKEHPEMAAAWGEKVSDALAQWRTSNPEKYKEQIERARAQMTQLHEENPEEAAAIRLAGAEAAKRRVGMTVPPEIDFEGNVVLFLSKPERRYFLGRRDSGVRIRAYDPLRDGVRRVFFQKWRRYTPDFVEIDEEGREVSVEVKGFKDIQEMVRVENMRSKGGRKGDLSMAKRDQHRDIRWVFIN